MHARRQRERQEGEMCKYLIHQLIPEGLRREKNVSPSIISQAVPELTEIPLIHCYDFNITLRLELGVT